MRTPTDNYAKILIISILIKKTRSGGHDGEVITNAEASVSPHWPMVFDGGFRVRDSGCGN